MRIAALLLLSLLLLGQPTAPRAEVTEADYRALVQQTIEAHIRPRLATFAETAEATWQDIAAFCAGPEAAAFAPLQEEVATLLLGWAAVEHLDLGPMRDAYRRDRIFFFPDRRGITGRHLARALANRETALLDPALLAEASVALQGLPALELLFFDSGAEAAFLAGDAAATYRCQLATAIAGNVVRLTRELSEGWAPEADFVVLLQEPGPENPLFRSPEEAASAVAVLLDRGMGRFQLEKLIPTMGAVREEAHPLRAPLHISGLTNEALLLNLEALRAFFVESGLARLMARASDWSARAALSVHRELSAAIAALPAPLPEAVVDPEVRPGILPLRYRTGLLRRFYGPILQGNLNLKIFVDAIDGD